MEDVAKPPPCHVVVIPYPGRGHINPLISLCGHLSALYPNILISFVLTEEWLGFIASAPRSSNIRLHSIPNVIPSEKVRGADFAGFLEAVFTKMAEPVDLLLDQLHRPISCILTDTYLNWAVEIGNRRNIPVASVFTMSPAIFSIFCHYDLIQSDPKWPKDEEDELPGGEERLDCIPGVSSIRIKDLPFPPRGATTLNRALLSFSAVPRAQCLVFTSFYELDPQTTDALRSILPMPIYTLGPNIPYMSLNNQPSPPTHLDYLNWLDDQPKSSVLYVSLGSFLSLSGPQIDELSAGLRSSRVRFLWITRSDSTRMRETTATNGQMGLVIPWCDQLKVLCHPSIGGFLTHCGWNSTLEAVFAGLPIIAFPIFWDQLTNAKYIVEDWKVGIRLEKEAGDGGIVKSDKIAETVRRVMDLDGVESKELRSRARQLQESCKRAIGREGSSIANLVAFFEEIVKGNGN